MVGAIFELHELASTRFRSVASSFVSLPVRRTRSARSGVFMCSTRFLSFFMSAERANIKHGVHAYRALQRDGCSTETPVHPPLTKRVLPDALWKTTPRSAVLPTLTS